MQEAAVGLSSLATGETSEPRRLRSPETVAATHPTSETRAAGAGRRRVGSMGGVSRLPEPRFVGWEPGTAEVTTCSRGRQRGSRAKSARRRELRPATGFRRRPGSQGAHARGKGQRQEESGNDWQMPKKKGKNNGAPSDKRRWLLLRNWGGGRELAPIEGQKEAKAAASAAPASPTGPRGWGWPSPVPPGAQGVLQGAKSSTSSACESGRIGVIPAPTLPINEIFARPHPP